ncbi:alpha/beta fold hydrolase [Streptomyces galbus]|uniref:alpha/beta fold hydrolase n=1 Tax=Streptomyces galbus TaxID=33898 RepID=UPI0019859D33|nr:alpha/beta hydrolase [Streptomyces galbus]GHD49964.1 hypothetical protein GCM10010335_60190 [Streptomyces galbus]
MVAAANLDRHADDGLRLLDEVRLTGVTLVGHSYGGMVISAAADRADPRWRVSEVPTGHDAMREAPDAVAALLA